MCRIVLRLLLHCVVFGEDKCGTWIFRETYFRELAHAIVKAWLVQNLQGRPAGRRLREELQFESKGHLLAEFLLAWGGQSSVPARCLSQLRLLNIDWVA